MQPCSLRGTRPYWFFQTAYWATAGLALILSALSQPARGETLLVQAVFFASAIAATSLLCRLVEGMRRLALSWTWTVAWLLLAAALLGALGHAALTTWVFPDGPRGFDLGILLLAWAVLYSALVVHLSASSRVNVTRVLATPPAGRGRYLRELKSLESPASTPALAHVDYLQDGNEGMIAVAGTRRHRVSASIRTLERALDPACFVRVRRGVIVNLERIVGLDAAADGEYRLRFASGESIRSSRSYQQLLDRLARREGLFAA